MAGRNSAVKNLKTISAVYERIDDHFEEMRERFPNSDELVRIEEEQRLNNQAYFVMAWGQLEAEVDSACKHAVDAGQSQEKWKARRAWGGCQMA